MSVVTVEEQSGVALVTLNRPDANNALNRASFRGDYYDLH
jgi:enoyl-CoA hydratase/carnithine racemase